MKNFTVLGLNFTGGHDSSAAIMVNGKLISAYEEERFNLEKHTGKFPINSINQCLKDAKIRKKNIDLICLGFDQKKFINEIYDFFGKNSKIKIFDHYDCHHASVFFPSDHKKSLLVCYDGKAEYATSSIKIGDKNKIKNLGIEDYYPNSLGYTYAAITFYLGWKFFCV